MGDLQHENVKRVFKSRQKTPPTRQRASVPPSIHTEHPTGAVTMWLSQGGDRRDKHSLGSWWRITVSLFHINRTTVWSCVFVVGERT